ncbi:MAG TPA: peptide chain release factor-like protein [Acidimicrobiales bacterium]|nr:peptide chain release factor-like protein [Acidimicrobiales bacterium]
MPDGPLLARCGIVVPPQARSWRFSRSSGPGGQHVNTADTRVELICDLAEIAGPQEVVELVRERLGPVVRVVAANGRSQLANREEAERRLLTRIDAAATRRRPRRPTRPSHNAVEARLEDKHRRSRRKAERRAPAED